MTDSLLTLGHMYNYNIILLYIFDLEIVLSRVSHYGV